MVRLLHSPLTPAVLLVAGVLASSVWAQDGPPLAAPTEPVTAIIEAFRTHDVVALCDAHGNRQSQMFLEALVRDPHFPTVAHDIVVEFGARRP